MSDARSERVENIDLVLLANFVHQIINPLNGVAGTLDNLIDGKIDETRRLQRTNAVRAQVENCITLLRNLAFLASNAGPLATSEYKIVVLPQIIIEGAMYYQEEGRSKRIEINLRDRSTQNKVMGHTDLIRQVLMNIFDNCIKYSRPGTEVTVDQRIQRSSGMAVIEIRSVPQLPLLAAQMEKIFDLGYRADNARAIVASGTGLGLYICRQLVERVHGGRISVSRHKDQLEFMIKLPRGKGPGDG